MGLITKGIAGTAHSVHHPSPSFNVFHAQDGRCGSNRPAATHPAARMRLTAGLRKMAARSAAAVLRHARPQPIPAWIHSHSPVVLHVVRPAGGLQQRADHSAAPESAAEEGRAGGWVRSAAAGLVAAVLGTQIVFAAGADDDEEKHQRVVEAQDVYPAPPS
jgi:hypothetical protein